MHAQEEVNGNFFLHAPSTLSSPRAFFGHFLRMLLGVLSLRAKWNPLSVQPSCLTHTRMNNPIKILFFHWIITDNHKDFQPTPLLNIDEQGMFLSAIRLFSVKWMNSKISYDLLLFRMIFSHRRYSFISSSKIVWWTNINLYRFRKYFSVPFFYFWF